MQLKFLLSLVVLLSLSANIHAQSPASLIQKKWVAVGILEGGKETPYEARYRQPLEVRFNNGKYEVYRGGIIQGTAKYTLAGDGKSLVIESGGRSLPMQILKLNQESLQLRTETAISGSETIAYVVAGSKQHKAIQQQRGGDAWAAVSAAWERLCEGYQRRQRAYDQFIAELKYVDGFDKTVLDRLAAANKAATAPQKAASALSAADIEKLMAAQPQLRDAFTKAESLIKSKFPDTSPLLMILEDSLASAQNHITFHRMEYNKVIESYNRNQAQQGAPIRDIAFKAQAGSPNPPKVSF